MKSTAESTTSQPIPCPNCPPEVVAQELAKKLGLDEYIAQYHGLHYRLNADGPIARATYHIPYWHALVAQSAREVKLIQSRVG